MAHSEEEAGFGHTRYHELKDTRVLELKGAVDDGSYRMVIQCTLQDGYCCGYILFRYQSGYLEYIQTSQNLFLYA